MSLGLQGYIQQCQKVQPLHVISSVIAQTVEKDRQLWSELLRLEPSLI